jgi:hypothetical protein
MHAILASMILLAIQQAPQQSLLREVVPNPTGRNGYEEYLMACDVVRNTRVALILTSPSELQAVVRDYEAPSQPGDELNEKLAKPSLERYDAERFIFSDRDSNAEKTASDFLQRMTDADKRRVVQICREHLAKQQERLVASYRRPESEWDLPVDEAEEFPENRAVRTAEDMGLYLAGNISPAFSQIGSVEVRNRTQFRLLRLSAAVVRYKWEHDKLPATLAEAVGEESLTDPASGDKFQYEVQGSGFKVWSKGTPRTGEIGLRYVRTQQGQDGPPPPGE